MEQPRPDEEVIERRALALPHAEGAELLTHVEVAAFYEELKSSNPQLYKNIQEQINDIDEQLEFEYGEKVEPWLRRLIVARAAIAGAAQVVSDTGQSLLDIDSLKQLLSEPRTGMTQPDDPAAA